MAVANHRHIYGHTISENALVAAITKQRRTRIFAAMEILKLTRTEDFAKQNG